MRKACVRGTAAGAVPFVLLALTACGGGATAPTPAATVDSPLEAAIDAFAWSEQDQRDKQARSTQAENLVAECMATEAFEYFPMDVVAAGALWDKALEGSGTETWIAQYGYGIGLHTVVQGEGSSRSANQEYLDTLSEAEIEAYELALWGAGDAHPTLEQADAGMVEDWRKQGCMGAGYHEIYEPDLSPIWDEFADLFEAIRDLSQSRLDDPRMVDVSARWADCMADAGHPGYTVPDDAYVALSDTYNGLFGGAGTPTATQLADFRELEITTAMTDYTCQETVGWAAAADTVQLELESAFVADHKADIDQYVAAVQAVQEAAR